jgi:2-methylcitrate dehydratase PrpD
MTAGSAASGSAGAGSATGSTVLEQLVERLWLLRPAEADLAAAEMRCYDAAVAMTLGPTVHVWPPARRVLGMLWQGTPASGAVAATLATSCRITEVDDIHLRSCTTPGAIAVPVALGLATAGLPHPGLLRGVVIGYEAAVGAAAAIGGPAALLRGVWPTRAVAPVAAAATAAAAMGLPREQALQAVALAAGVGLTGTMPEPARELGLGYAVLIGLAAAVTAADGVTGDLGLLERWPGLASAGAAASPLEPLPGARLAVHDACVKPFCAARQSLAATAAVADLAAAEKVTADQVIRVEAGVPPAHLVMVNRARIASRLDAIASLPYQIAMALQCPAMLDDIDRPAPRPVPELAGLMDKVRVVPEPDLERDFPARWGAWVRLTTTQGTYAKAVSEVPSERTLDWPRLTEKAARLFGRAQVDPAQASALHEQVRGHDLAGLADGLYRRAMQGRPEGSSWWAN